jgi:HPt (histidine-containing phosphotransfer) domain-containing protein
VDIVTLAGRLGLESDEFVDLAALFLQTALADIDKLETAGREADAVKAAALAHALKGSSGNLGFVTFSQAARSAEDNAKNHDFTELAHNIKKMRQLLAEIERAVT